MSLVFSYRSNTTSAYYAPGGELSGYFDQGQTTLAKIVDCTLAGCFGGKALDLNNTSFNSWRNFNGIGNTPTSSPITIVYRMSKGVAGTSAANDSMIMLGGDTSSFFCGLGFGQQSGDRMLVYLRNELGQAGTNVGGNTVGFYNFNTNSFRDISLVHEGTTTAQIYLLANGVTIGGASTTRSINFDVVGNPYNSITLGRFVANNASDHYCNEVLIFNKACSAATLAALALRSDFYSTTANQPYNSTDPLSTNVATGVNYTFKGTSLTGSFGAVYTDPGIENVENEVSYIFNGVTLTGTLAVPQASTGTAGTIPIGELKEQIRYILDANNTTTGAPTQNLSANMRRKVRGILKVNPDKLGPPQENQYPCVTVFCDQKMIEPVSIASNGLQGKRRAEVILRVMGMIWEPFTTNLKTDPADNDCEILMENIERVLRAYDTLGGNVKWQYPTQVTYHSFAYDEEAHLRTGIMEIKATLYY